jgi:hypothetical protein
MQKTCKFKHNVKDDQIVRQNCKYNMLEIDFMHAHIMVLSFVDSNVLFIEDFTIKIFCSLGEFIKVTMASGIQI